jgi:hypothetical protein
MNIIEPDVFYSDIVLGIILFIIAYTLLEHRQRLGWCFGSLGMSTFFGAFYHGLYDTTQIFAGDVLWSLTMTMYGLSSFLFINFALQKHFGLTKALVGTFLFSLFTILVNESFLYGLILQGMAILVLGHYVFKTQKIASLYVYGLFVIITLFAIYIQQKKITFGLNYSHNTWFHIIQIPAILLLYLSLKNNSSLPQPN